MTTEYIKGHIKRNEEIRRLENIAVAKGIDLEKVKHMATTTVHDYKTCLMHFIEKRTLFKE